MQKNRNCLLSFAVGAVLGAAVFIMIFGASVIVPTNTNWLFAYVGDATQHQLGWEFYRNSGLSFPIGLTEGLSCEGKVSCLYSDSLPLFAMIFKPLSPVLPDNFQYFGLWGVICFALNGGCGAALLYRIKPDVLFASVGSLFYVLFPPTVDRIMHHNTLGAVWLLIIPIILVLDRKKEHKHKFTYTLYWCAVCMLAASIHPYFLPMIFMVMAGYVILAVFRDKTPQTAIITAVASAFSSALALFLIGAFHGNGKYNDGGFGFYSSNLNTFFNSMGKSVYLDGLDALEGQTEGFGYLGLGALICCIAAVISVIIVLARKEGSFRHNAAMTLKERKVDAISFAAVFFVSFFWAVSTTVTLGDSTVVDIPLPWLIRGCLGVFRASGRFIWLPGILLTTAALAGVSKLGKRSAVIAAVFCVAVQFLDMRDWHSEQRKMFAKQPDYEFALKDEKWDELTENTDEIVFLPMKEQYGLYMDMYFDFAQLAVKKDMRLSSFYLARLDYDAVAEYSMKEYSALKNGSGRQDILYVFFDEADVLPETDTLSIYRIDGYSVAKVK